MPPSLIENIYYYYYLNFFNCPHNLFLQILPRQEVGLSLQELRKALEYLLLLFQIILTYLKGSLLNRQRRLAKLFTEQNLSKLSSALLMSVNSISCMWSFNTIVTIFDSRGTQSRTSALIFSEAILVFRPHWRRVPPESQQTRALPPRPGQVRRDHHRPQGGHWVSPFLA